MKSTRPTMLTVVLFALGACSEPGADASLEAGGDWTDTATREGTDTDTPSDPTDDVAGPPALLELTGQLDIISGGIGKANSSLTIRVLDAQAISICSFQPELIFAAPAILPDDTLEVWGWWNVGLAVPLDACGLNACVSPNFSIGIGHLDPLLNAALDANGFDYQVAPQTLYGLYFQQKSGTPTYIYGVVGTVGNLDGVLGTVPGSTVPNGIYFLDSLHFLPLPECSG